MKPTVLTLASALLLASTTVVAGTKITGSIAPAPSDCFSGPDFCKNGLAMIGACAPDNSDCTGGTLMRAKLKLKDTLELKLIVRKLTDNTGSLVTTDGTIDTADDHILKLAVNRCIVEGGVPTHCQNLRSIYVKFDVTDGKAVVIADLSQAFAADPSLTAIGIIGASLAAQSTVPGACPGTNSAADIAARVDDPDCDPLGGLVYGLYGIVKP